MYGEHEDVGRPGPFVLVVHPSAMFACCRDRRACLLEQLDRLLVHAQHRTRRIVRHGVGVQHLLHCRNELGVGLRRDDPVLALPIRHAVFFRVRRRVSWLTDATISNSIPLRANSRSDQLAYPGGGEPRRIAMTFASCSPSNSLGVGGWVRLIPFNACSKPHSTRRRRTFSTVLLRQPNASAIRRSVQLGPSASALSRIWARRTFWPVPFNFLTTSPSSARSRSVRRTTYFFTIRASLLHAGWIDLHHDSTQKTYPNC